jgi:hypothetical protein
LELKNTLPEETILNAEATVWSDLWLWIFVASAFLYSQTVTQLKGDWIAN